MKDKEKTKNQPTDEPIKKERILIVEDEGIISKDIKKRLQRFGYTVSGIAISGEDAVKKAEELHPDLVLMDIILEGKMNGVNATEIIHSRLNIPIVYLTAHSDKKTLERAKKTEPFGYVLKPFDDRDLYITIEMALYKHKMETMLKESESLNLALFQHNPIQTVVVDRSGRVINFNMAKKKSEVRLPNIGDVMYKDYAGKHKIDMHAELMGCIKLRKTKRFPELKYNNKFLDISIASFPQGAIITSQDITERKKAEERITHLNAVLRVIRNVNQLLSKEKDRDKLIKSTCENLIETRSYYNAWIALLDGSGTLVTTAEAGLGKNFLPLIQQIKSGNFPDCGQKSLKRTKPMLIRDPSSTCTNCPLAGSYTDRGAMTVRLEYGGKIYGLLSVSIPREFAAEKEEKDLLGEIANDIALALNNIEAEKEIKTQRDRAQSYLDLAAVMFLAINTKGDVILINRKGCEILGYKEEEIVGKNWFDNFIPERLKDEIKSVSDKLLEGKMEPVEYFENPVLTRYGEERLIAWHNTIIKDEKGNITGHLSSGEDITERKMGEQFLKESEERYRDLVEKAGIAVLIDDKEGNLIYFNEKYLEMYGYSRKEMEKKSIQSLIHPDDVDMVLEHHKNRIQGRRAPSRYEYRAIRKDGSIFHLEVDAVALRENGRITGSRSYIWDITERKKTEGILKKSEQGLSIRNQIANIFLTKPDEEVYGEVLKVVLEATKSKYGVFGYIDENGTLVCPSMTRDVWDKCKIPAKDIVFPRETWEGIWGKALMEKKILFSNKPFIVPEGHIPILRALDVPIIFQDKVIGNLLVGNKATDYEKKDKELLETIMKFIAPILNERLERYRQETARKKVEDALRKSEMTYRALFESGNDPVTILSLNGTLVSANKKAAEILGYKVEEIIGMSYENIIASSEIQDAANKLKSLQKGKALLPYERIIQRKDGTKFPCEVNLSPVFDKDNKLQFLQSIFRDITERKQAEEELKTSREQLRNLAAHLQSVREGERTSIAREIHDDLGQSLTALKMDLSLLTPKLPQEQKSLLKKTKSMSKLIDSTIQTVQRISSELRPGVLDDIGLPAALEWQANEFQKRTGIKCELIIDPEDIFLDKDLSTAIFRIFQETLTNVARHSKAKWVKVNLIKKAKKFELKVRDNGRGITDEQISNSKSFGLIGIRERIQFFGGDVEIKGIQNRGTTLTAWIPLPKDKKN